MGDRVREIMQLFAAWLTSVLWLLTEVAASTCDYSQVSSNPLFSSATQRPAFGTDHCDRAFAGNEAGFYPCGGVRPSGVVYPPCDQVFDEMMGCGENYAPHSDCKFGDTFVGKIACKYADAKQSQLLPDEQQPVTCKEQ